MAVNEIEMSVPPERVFDVLSDPRSYGRWVVGSRAIHAADPAWPAPGSVFEHTQGFGPLPLLRDVTTVLACDTSGDAADACPGASADRRVRDAASVTAERQDRASSWRRCRPTFAARSR